MMNILAFESFDGGSHRQCRESISRHSKHSWNWITRPPRAWKWRMAISAQEMIDDAARQGYFDSKPDLIFATSLLDVAVLRASLPRGYRDIPLVLYMHENQVAYPTSDARDASFAFTNLQSILASDLVLFNSKWNMDSFVAGITELLLKAPDLELRDVENRIRSRSAVAWVPVELPLEEVSVLHNTERDGAHPIRIVWPHRWEHDKNPDALLAIAREHTSVLNLRWIILGEQFRETPKALLTFKAEFANQIDHIGFVDSKVDYWHWLHKADWVLSTADHEFFGVAVVEAMFAGCLPWLPEKLSYRELLPAEGRGVSPLVPVEDPTAVRRAIYDHLYMAHASNAVARIDDLLSSQI